MRPSARKIAFVLKGYPRLSESFIAQEIRGLEARGLDLVIVALRHPTDPRRHPIHDEIKAPVAYLPEYLRDDPARVARAWRMARCYPGYRAARAMWLKDLARDPTPNRVRRFGQALVLAAELGRDIGHLHAHFLHTPASVTRYASLIRGLPWTCSAHAKDIWTTPAWEKREKLASCAWAVACSRAARDHLAALAPPGRVELVYHGIDPVRFPPRGGEPGARDGRQAGEPVRLLAVGRAVEKKGFDHLVAALARLPRDLAWRLTHVGGGPLLAGLKARAAAAGVTDRIEWAGPLPQNEVLDHYRAADLFVLPSQIAADGDRDGLPNVLLEAQSQGLACIASDVAAVPELIRHGESGWLVPPADAPALAQALAALIAAPALRQRLGEVAEKTVRHDFGCAKGLDRLAQKFGAGAG
ncbi:MAG: glycosyltransferase family 4 protein [Alphaproteobacteria bacterium]|nr:glycosyltransferase family 4 protein [Alphaproteobacteria bacterium]